MVSAQELDININASARQMAETIFGDGVDVIRARFFGDRRSSATFEGGDATSGRVTPSDEGVILSTGQARDFTNSGGDPNRNTDTTTNTTGINNDAQFNSIAAATTFDAAILEVDFTPTTNFLSMQFTFSSEEYPEFTGSIFNDAVGIWINGVLVTNPIINIAQINSINQSSNETLFVDNTQDQFNTEMDGFTVTLSVLIPVNIGEENTIRIGIADVADNRFDSALLIAADSIQGEFITADDMITLNEMQVGVLDVLANDGAMAGGIMTITHVNGIEVTAGETVTLSSGHAITLLADGTLEIVPPDTLVDLTGPESVNFTYTAENADGVSDTAFVTVTSVPCFVRGTRIRTERGEVRVEHLAVGDMVETRDHGPQPIRWIGQRTIPALGRHAPVVIEAGTFGLHERLVVSPQHRVMLTHYMADLMFGEDEVLVAAKDLVNDVSVRIAEGGEVEYFHVLFDTHQIIWSEGLLTESFLPGPQVMNDLDRDARDEVLRLFPELDPQSHEGYGPSARPGLRAYETRALLG